MPSVLFMDLDDFKTVNDSLGHVAGDRLLADVAARVQQCLRLSDTAARLGGDEFAVLVEDSAGGASRELATRVLAALAAPFDVDGTQVHVRASIGIAAADTRQRGPDAVASLLRNADVAMYSAKGEGGVDGGRSSRPCSTPRASGSNSSPPSTGRSSATS